MIIQTSKMYCRVWYNITKIFFFPDLVFFDEEVLL